MSLSVIQKGIFLFWTLASGVVSAGSSWVRAREACLCNTLQREPVKEGTVQRTGSVNI